MALKLCQVLLCFGILLPAMCLSEMENESETGDDYWLLRLPKHEKSDSSCSGIRPPAKDIVRRFYAILPYFDKDRKNTVFLHKYRGTVYGMSDSDDILEREAGFYAAVLTPLVFLQQYRDSWCLLERFHHALRLYQATSVTDKRSSLKLLQNFRSVNKKVRSFVMDLTGWEPVTPVSTEADLEDDDILHDKKDIRYLKELIKNLG